MAANAGVRTIRSCPRGNERMSVCGSNRTESALERTGKRSQVHAFAGMVQWAILRLLDFDKRLTWSAAVASPMGQNRKSRPVQAGLAYGCARQRDTGRFKLNP
jgi:hypothetical protein